MRGLFCFQGGDQKVRQEEFNKLLKKSGLSEEFVIKLNQIIRVVKDHEERLVSLEARSTTPYSNLKK